MTEPTCKSRFTFRLPDYWPPDQAPQVTAEQPNLAIRCAIRVRKYGASNTTLARINIELPRSNIR